MKMRRTRSWTWSGHRNRVLLPLVTLIGWIALATPARASDALRVRGGDEGPDSTEATPGNGVGPRDCTVRFEHDVVSIIEDVPHGLVDYSTASGTATVGSDYTSKNGSLSFSGNVKTRNISIAILNDGDDESDENFTVTLSNWEHTDVSDGTGVVTIRDDDEETIDPPSAPGSLAAAPGDGEVTLTWVAPADDGGGTISGYQYRHAKESGSYPEEWTDVPGGSGGQEGHGR